MLAEKNNRQEQENTLTPSPSPYGENPLSDREMEVSRLLVTGASNSEIARELVISPHTVKVHLRNVFEKLQVNSRTEASMVLLQRGWLTVPGVEVAPPVRESPKPETHKPIPEPEPLSDVPAQPLPWQRVYLLTVTVICLLALLLPNWLSRPKTSFSLLSDAGQTIVGKPAVELQPRWEARTPLLQPRSRMGVVQINDQIYVIGGEGADGQTLPSLDAYDLHFNQWRSLSPLPAPLANAAAADLDGKIYVAGGSANDPRNSTAVSISDDLLVFDPDTGKWHHAGKLPVAVAGASLVAYDHALYLLGGWDGHAMHDEVWRVTPDGPTPLLSSQWEVMTHLTVPMAFFGAVLVGDEFYVVGGYDGKRELADANVFNLLDNQWRRIAALSTPRSGLSVVDDGLAVLALGGGWTRTVDTHERYDPLTNQWSNFPSPIRGEWRHFVAAAKDGSVHLIGGWSGDYLDTHLQYQSTFRALLPVINNN